MLVLIRGLGFKLLRASVILSWVFLMRKWCSDLQVWFETSKSILQYSQSGRWIMILPLKSMEKNLMGSILPIARFCLFPVVSNLFLTPIYWLDRNIWLKLNNHMGPTASKEHQKHSREKWSVYINHSCPIHIVNHNKQLFWQKHKNRNMGIC